MKFLALTAGEPAGIGPDLCIQWASRPRRHDVVVLADREALLERARLMQVPLRIVNYEPGTPAVRQPGELTVLHLAQARPAQAGIPDPANAQYVLSLLDRAIAGCRSGEFSALVTAPLHKGIINDAGIAFTGHTEYLAAATATPHVVMMLVGGGLRVALATTHLPLRAVADAITADSLTRTLDILHQSLRTQFDIAQPHILVAGLNPHAGESGHLGDEELRIIGPVLDRLRARGMHLSGPLPADTLFQPALLANADCVLAMYHDQGLPVLKYASFGSGVNITLGLPFIRTSVDHGTAFDLAGSGRALTGSLDAAIDLAAQLGAGHG
ncbi:MAG: 4-hydroxythreonine-4-phosphate dehydrogenase PdxA [Betaproteobacteria bacterium]|nr:4-hydroxythreonine-4-phosphate dehydrogenase PdxA [Betaproteobacteria bacterium]